MKTCKVRLPNEPEISVEFLAQCMIDAIDPNLCRAIKMDCIIGKRFPKHHRPTYIEYLDNALSQDEYISVKKILSKLPHIYSGINQEELKEFDKQFKYKLEVKWCPNIFDLDTWLNYGNDRNSLKEEIILDVYSFITADVIVGIDLYKNKVNQPRKFNPQNVFVSTIEIYKILGKLSKDFILIPEIDETIHCPDTIKKQWEQRSMCRVTNRYGIPLGNNIGNIPQSTDNLLDSEPPLERLKQLKADDEQQKGQHPNAQVSIIDDGKIIPEHKTSSLFTSTIESALAPASIEEQEKKEIPQQEVIITNRKISKNVKLNYVMDMTNLSKSTIYGKMNSQSKYFDPTFPCSFKLQTQDGKEPAGNSSAFWDQDEVDNWVKNSKLAVNN